MYADQALPAYAVPRKQPAIRPVVRALALATIVGAGLYGYNAGWFKNPGEKADTVVAAAGPMFGDAITHANEFLAKNFPTYSQRAAKAAAVASASTAPVVAVVDALPAKQADTVVPPTQDAQPAAPVVSSVPVVESAPVAVVTGQVPQVEMDKAQADAVKVAPETTTTAAQTTVQPTATAATTAPVVATATEAAVIEAPKISAADLLQSARAAFASGNFNAAIESYRGAIAANGGELSAYGELGNVYHLNGMEREAAQAYFDAASKAIEQNRLDLAEDLLPAVIDGNPKLAFKLSGKLFLAHVQASLADFD